MLKAARMWALIGFSVVAGLMLQSNLLLKAASLAEPVHRLCLDLAPDSPYRVWAQALVCAAPLPTHSSALSDTGAIHLMISQGLHLTSLLWLAQSGQRAVEHVWRTFHSKRLRPTPGRHGGVRTLDLLVAIFYAAVVGFKPPITRAVLALGMRQVSFSGRLHWSRVQRTIHSCLACLALDSSLWTSHSLQLTWAGCLGMACAQTHLARGALAFAATTPLLLPIQGANPFAVAIAWALAPAFVFLIFPLTVLTFAAPSFTPFVDALWVFALGLIDEIDTTLFPHAWVAPALGASRLVRNEGWRWLYIAALSLLAWRHERSARMTVGQYSA